MSPGHIYYAMLLFVVLPSAAFSRVALVILLAWVCGEMAVTMGAPEVTANFCQHAAALTLALLVVRSVSGMVATALFIPLVVVDAMWGLGMVEPVVGWWSVLCLATLQAAVLPFANDWKRVRRTWKAYHNRRRIDRALRLAPC